MKETSEVQLCVIRHVKRGLSGRKH